MRRIAVLLIAGNLLVPAAVSAAANPGPGLYPQGVSELVGEEVDYALDFLVFRRLAAGKLALRATGEPTVFEAELVGRTLGVAAWLTGDRTQRYVSRMQLMPDGRLRSLVHESQILKRKRGDWRRTGKRYRYDYTHGRVSRERFKHGRFGSAEVFDLPPGSAPVDILTAFYNLRSGVYGAVSPGVTLRIPAFFKDGVSEITVDVLTPEEQRKHAFFPAGGTLLRVHIDPEVFETGSGDLYVWFDAAGVPERGIVEDVIGMGDVRGYQEENRP